MSDWLLILFSAFACNYHPVKYQKLLVNANPGSTSACSVFWCTHNCCNAVVSVKLAKATRKTDYQCVQCVLVYTQLLQRSGECQAGQGNQENRLSSALILYWPGIIYKHTGSGALRPHLKDLTWWGFPTQHSTDMRPDWGLLKTKQHKDLEARAEVLACRVSVHMIWWRRPVMMRAYPLLRIDQQSVALVLNRVLTEFSAWLYRSTVSLYDLMKTREDACKPALVNRSAIISFSW